MQLQIIEFSAQPTRESETVESFLEIALDFLSKSASQ
mgnify:CR=1 FL=1